MNDRSTCGRLRHPRLVGADIEEQSPGQAHGLQYIRQCIHLRRGHSLRTIGKAIQTRGHSTGSSGALDSIHLRTNIDSTKEGDLPCHSSWTYTTTSKDS